jgi:hypothetical protein
MSETTGELLDVAWQQTLLLVEAVLAAYEDKHLSISEMITLGRHGVELVAAIVHVIQQADPEVRQRLRQDVQAQRAAAPAPEEGA